MTLKLEMQLRDMGLLADTWLQELQDVTINYTTYKPLTTPTIEIMEYYHV